MNEKKYPWPVEYFKNVSYLYPWYLERVRLYYCRYTTLDLSDNEVKKAENEKEGTFITKERMADLLGRNDI